MASRKTPPWARDRGTARTERPVPKSTVPVKRSGDALEDAWVADEDRFVLQQAKNKAVLRIKNGRAKPIDWLAVILRAVDPTKSLLDEEMEGPELEVIDPVGLLEGLEKNELAELADDVDQFLRLETHRSNRDYWTVSFPSNLVACLD
jgi:hypothetical protein